MEVTASDPSGRPQRRRLAVLFAACLATVVALLPQTRAELTPQVEKKIALLEAKLAKRQAKLVELQAALGEAQAVLLAAQLQLLQAQDLPTGTLEDISAQAKAVKLATKAVKKATAKVVRLEKRVDKLQALIASIMAAIEALDPGHFDQDGGPGGGDPEDPPDPDPTGGNPLDPAASHPLRAVDCGDLNGYASVEEGWELLSDTEAPADVALDPAPLDVVHVARFFPGGGIVAFPSSVATLDPDQSGQRRLLTSLQLADPTTLSVGGFDPNTDLRVVLELGAASPWMEIISSLWTELPTAAPDIDVEGWTGSAWQSVARNVRASTGMNPSTWAADLGGIVRVWVPARSDDAGVIRLRFSSSSDGPIFLAAFAVYLDEPLPIVKALAAGGALTSLDPDADDFVAAFDAGDLDAAQQAALALTDDWLRGVALCHLIGWLDGSRDGRVALIGPALNALVAARDAGHAGAVLLLSQLGSLQRALRHVEAGDSVHAKQCPEQGGYGFLNPDCAGQVYQKIGQYDGTVNVHIAQRELAGIIAPAAGPTALDDLLQWEAGTLTATRWSPSPLLPRALEQWAANLAVMNPQLSVNLADPLSTGMNDDFRSVFQKFTTLGFAATEFPDEVELKLFKAYADENSHPKNWAPSAMAVLSDAEIDASWWGADAALPAVVAGVPTWANQQRRALLLYRNLCAYWLEDRLVGGEFGGGPGDDVELMLQLFPLLSCRRDGTDRLLASGFDDALQWALEDTEKVGAGYYDGNLTDVEHAAEYVTDPFLAARGAFGFTARAARAAIANARELHDTDDPGSAFLGLNDAGRMRFRSFHYTANEVSEDPALAIDLFLNGRAMAPALALAARGTLVASAAPLADLRDWAEGWRADAMLGSGKPEGFPAAARWPSGALGGTGGWYTDNENSADVSAWTSGEVSYVLGLLQGAYRSSTAADRWKLLLPAVRMLRAAKSWEDAGQPNGAVGTANWAAKTFRQATRFGPLVASLYPDLAADSTLTTQTDPGNPSTTYVDAALLTRMALWSKQGNNDLGHVFAYAAADVAPCAAHSLKNTTSLTQAFAEAVVFYRNMWPLLTTRVLHTDRVFLNQANVLRELAAAFTGSINTEGLPLRPLVHWSGEGLDIAVLTNHVSLQGGEFSALVYNFAAEAANVTLQLDEGLPAGQYTLQAGTASPTCDTFPSPPGFVTALTKRGVATSAAVSLAPGLSLVVLTRTGDATPPAGHDWALDPPRLVRQSDDSYVVHVRVVNAGSSAAPAASMDLHVAAVAANGTLGAPAALPSELLLSSTSLGLAGVTGFDVPEEDVSFSLPLGSPLIALLDEGWGIQFRASVPASASESDTLNNVATRTWFADDALEE